jgi:hypothetical protein
MKKEFIDSLAAELKPRKSPPSLAVYMFRWSIGIALITILSLWILPLRSDLHTKFFEPRFWIESSIWLIAAAISASLVYLSSLPSRLNLRNQWIGWAPIVVLVALLLTRLQTDAFALDFSSEMDLYRGRCGIIILLVGVLASTGLFALIRKNAPTRPAFTGAWAAASAGCIGSFMMQFVCQYENAAHLFFWHFLPLLLLGVIGTQFGKKILHW